MLLNQSVPVGVCSDTGVAEAVLHHSGGADVLVQELLPCLLGDGLRRHDAESHTTGGKWRT